MTRPALTDGDVRRLTPNQRDLLIEHVDGEVDVVKSDHHQSIVRNSLMQLGMLRGTEKVRPRFTVLTDRGRLALAMVLGQCADSLVRAGLLEQPNPLDVLRRLKEQLALDGPVIPRVRPHRYARKR